MDSFIRFNDGSYDGLFVNCNSLYDEGRTNNYSYCKRISSYKRKSQRALQETFDSNFEQWDAELLGDMTIRFNNPEVLFKTGSDKIRPKFAEILEDFIPRYTSIILSEKFKDSIKEIRIEGIHQHFGLMLVQNWMHI